MTEDFCQPNTTFRTSYRALEEQMRIQAEADGNVFLPNPEPEGPVDYVLICMEPSLGRWARNAEEARVRVKEGFKNFVSSVEISILHFCVRHYLCGPAQRYHITDLSKGAMLVKNAPSERIQRYHRWYPLLEKELNLVTTPNAKFVAVGNVVTEYLKQRRFSRPLTQIMHYSSLAGNARKAGIAGRESSFESFKSSVTLDDLRATVDDVLKKAQVSSSIKNETLSRLAKSRLSESHLQLIYNYKIAFEAMR